MARALVVIAALAALAPPAQAQQPHIEFTVRPAAPGGGDPRTNAWLIHRARPGSVVRDEVVVENLGEVPLDLVLYPADAHSTAEGQFGLQPADAPRQDVARWVRLDRSRLRLAPGEQERVGVVVRVPRDATPGDHPGGVVARLARPIGEGPIGTLLAVGARLYLRVPGRLVEDLRVLDVRPEVEGRRARFLVEMENAGNTMLEVTGAYTLEGRLGMRSGAGDIGAPIVLLPGARAVRPVVHGHDLFGGPYRASFTLRYGDDGVRTAEASFSVAYPWALFLALLLIVATGTALAVRSIRSRRAY